MCLSSKTNDDCDSVLGKGDDARRPLPLSVDFSIHEPAHDCRTACRLIRARLGTVPAMADLASHMHGLVELGMTRYEAKTYLTLIQRESFAASELATEAGIPRQRIYDVLNSLVARGLARDWPGPVTRYAATDPQAAVERLLGVQRQALAGLESNSTELADTLRETWESGRAETAPLDYVEVLRDPGLLGGALRRPAAGGRTRAAHLRQGALCHCVQPGRPGLDPPDRGCGRQRPVHLRAQRAGPAGGGGRNPAVHPGRRGRPGGR